MNRETRGRFITCIYCGHKFKFVFQKDRDYWIEKNKICPACKEKQCNKPKIEKELDILQTLYLKKREESYLNQMIELLNTYAESIIKKYYSFILNEEGDLQYYANNAVSFFIEEYFKNDDFRIYASFGGQLILKVKQAIYSKAEQRSADETLDFQFGDDNFIEHEDKTYNMIKRVEDKENKLQLSEYIYNLILQFNYNCSESENYLRLMAVWKNFIEGEIKADRLFREEKKQIEKVVQYKVYGKLGKLQYVKTMDLIRRELLSLEEKGS